jgi:hypothetical protein
MIRSGIPLTLWPAFRPLKSGGRFSISPDTLPQCRLEVNWPAAAHGCRRRFRRHRLAEARQRRPSPVSPMARMSRQSPQVGNPVAMLSNEGIRKIRIRTRAASFVGDAALARARAGKARTPSAATLTAYAPVLPLGWLVELGKPQPRK